MKKITSICLTIFIPDGGSHIADGQLRIFQQHLRVTQLVADDKLLGGTVHDVAAAAVEMLSLIHI